jgi:hypothetical protein
MHPWLGLFDGFRKQSNDPPLLSAKLHVPACTCMYLQLYRYRPGLDQPQHGEDFNASAVVKTMADRKA